MDGLGIRRRTTRDASAEESRSGWTDQASSRAVPASPGPNSTHARPRLRDVRTTVRAGHVGGWIIDNEREVLANISVSYVFISLISAEYFDVETRDRCMLSPVLLVDTRSREAYEFAGQQVLGLPTFLHCAGIAQACDDHHGACEIEDWRWYRRRLPEHRRLHTPTIPRGLRHCLPSGRFGSADPGYLGDGSRHNPEDLLVAALSACHMLWYLHLCAVNRVVVTDYEDAAEGTYGDAWRRLGRVP